MIESNDDIASDSLVDAVNRAFNVLGTRDTLRIIAGEVSSSTDRARFNVARSIEAELQREEDWNKAHARVTGRNHA